MMIGSSLVLLVIGMLATLLIVNMAMKEPLMVKTVEGNTDLELQADDGESFKVVDIQVNGPVSDWAEVSTSKTTVGYYRVGGVLGNHLAVPPPDSIKKTLLTLLYELGHWRGMPIATGEKLIIEGVAQAGAIQRVFYERHDEGDMKRDMPNGSESKEYDFINYGQPASVIDGENLYTDQLNPTQYPAFPFGAIVPSKTTIEILGILLSDIGKESGGGANEHVTTFLRFLKGRTTLWDEDRHGIPVRGLLPGADQTDVGLGITHFGNYNDIDQRYPLILPTPLTFLSGDELNAYIATVVSAGVANILVSEVKLGLIERVTPSS